jgi:SAM-dependent methyltransferase
MNDLCAPHWNRTYAQRDDQTLGWYEAAPDQSLSLIQSYLQTGEAFIDIGAGASRLIDHLLHAGFGPLYALDISETAFERSRNRLGPLADHINWIIKDATRWTPDRQFDLWHDRAMFHFLTDPSDRARYVQTMMRALRPGAKAIVASFAEDGPQKCAGLPTQRYSFDQLAAELHSHAPDGFRPVVRQLYTHHTPAGVMQKYQYSVFEKRG